MYCYFLTKVNSAKYSVAQCIRQPTFRKNPPFTARVFNSFFPPSILAQLSCHCYYLPDQLRPKMLLTV